MNISAQKKQSIPPKFGFSHKKKNGI